MAPCLRPQAVRFLSHTLDKRLGVLSHPALNTAVYAAERKVFPNGNWRWWRTDPMMFISPLIAATMAYDAAYRSAAMPEKAPLVWSSDDFEDLDELVKEFS